MPRSNPSEEILLIESALSAFPNGIGVADLEIELRRTLAPKTSRRSLQRRLQGLVATGRVTTEGRSTALVYKLTGAAGRNLSAPESKTPAPTTDTEEYVQVSPEGLVVRNQVRRPLMYRHPVGYQREFLENYEPGKTFYLPEPLRRQLHEMGRTPVAARPAGTYARDLGPAPR